eukprot:COSAG06_NODE_44974_length_358_cov_2.046332_1_plen_42_part_01
MSTPVAKPDDGEDGHSGLQAKHTSLSFHLNSSNVCPEPVLVK